MMRHPTKGAAMLTTREAADELGVTPARIRQLILSGRLPATKHGRDWDIPSLEPVRVRKPGRPRSEPDDGNRPEE